MASNRGGLLTVMALGRQIRYRRIVENMTQSECAALLDISPAQLSRIECGKAQLSDDSARRLELWWSRSTHKKIVDGDFDTHAVHHGGLALTLSD